MQPGKTIRIFDEIQICHRTKTSMKYFCETLPDLHVAATGSFLGMAVAQMGNNVSFPVGKVRMLTMYPLNFPGFSCRRMKNSFTGIWIMCLRKKKYRQYSPATWRRHIVDTWSREACPRLSVHGYIPTTSGLWKEYKVISLVIMKRISWNMHPYQNFRNSPWFRMQFLHNLQRVIRNLYSLM